MTRKEAIIAGAASLSALAMAAQSGRAEEAAVAAIVEPTTVSRWPADGSTSGIAPTYLLATIEP